MEIYLSPSVWRKIVFHLLYITGCIKYDCNNNIYRLIIKFDWTKLSTHKVSSKKNFSVFKENFIFGLFLAKCEKTIAIFGISTLEFFNKTKNALFGNFWAGIWKSHYHI